MCNWKSEGKGAGQGKGKVCLFIVAEAGGSGGSSGAFPVLIKGNLCTSPTGRARRVGGVCPEVSLRGVPACTLLRKEQNVLFATIFVR